MSTPDTTMRVKQVYGLQLKKQNLNHYNIIMYSEKNN